jgi:hypothetical protein
MLAGIGAGALAVAFTALGVAIFMRQPQPVVAAVSPAPKIVIT